MGSLFFLSAIKLFIQKLMTFLILVSFCVVNGRRPHKTNKVRRTITMRLFWERAAPTSGG